MSSREKSNKNPFFFPSSFFFLSFPYLSLSFSSSRALSSELESARTSPNRNGHTIDLIVGQTPPFATSFKSTSKSLSLPSLSHAWHHFSAFRGIRCLNLLLLLLNPSLSSKVGPCSLICWDAIVATAATEMPTPSPRVAPSKSAVPSPTPTAGCLFPLPPWSFPSSFSQSELVFESLVLVVG